MESIGHSLLNSPFKRCRGGGRGKKSGKLKKTLFFEAFLVRPSVPGGPAVVWVNRALYVQKLIVVEIVRILSKFWSENVGFPAV